MLYTKIKYPWLLGSNDDLSKSLQYLGMEAIFATLGDLDIQNMCM